MYCKVYYILSVLPPHTVKENYGFVSDTFKVCQIYTENVRRVTDMDRIYANPREKNNVY
jgi:hypothetical protein|uniref:Uncharacterized protein n=1 Tax=viral metagenome TaxID=1070528 RepID=A0A6C0BSV5_9ZZZZ